MMILIGYFFRTRILTYHLLFSKTGPESTFHPDGTSTDNIWTSQSLKSLINSPNGALIPPSGWNENPNIASTICEYPLFEVVEDLSSALIYVITVTKDSLVSLRSSWANLNRLNKVSGFMSCVTKIVAFLGSLSIFFQDIIFYHRTTTTLDKL